MRILRPKLLGDLEGPVSEPALRSNKLDNVKATLQLFKKSGIVAEAFEANDLFNFRRGHQGCPRTLLGLLKPLVGGVHKVPMKEGPPTDFPGDDRDESSSHYESPTEEVDTDSVDDPSRMTLGPSGTATLRNRAAQKAASSPTERGSAVASVTRFSPEKLGSFFQSAMGRFLEEQRTATAPEGPTPTGVQDVEMESVGSLDRFLLPNEYDRDDLDLIEPRRAAVATTSTAKSTIAPRIRVSAMSEMKAFLGKDGDEDRARSWLSKVKSAFLSRTTRSTWKDLLYSFQTQYCGHGVSVAKQYYHARKRSDESPLEYLNRLNVAGLRARIQVKDGPSQVRREHVDHFIETLDDRDLADHLALLRIPDAGALDEVLRSRQRAKARQIKSVYGSIKPRQKHPNATVPTRAVKAVHAAETSSDSEIETCETDDDEDLHRVYITTAGNHDKRQDRSPPSQDRQEIRDHPGGQYPRSKDLGTVAKRCPHCGSKKHDDLGCWGLLTCEQCGLRGHPTDRCFFVCKACGVIHEAGECPMEEFYNRIRQLFSPDKLRGMFPESAEKMLN
ncbi:hypothetical protein F442_00762 [Phytophthora nicotianae P10297]|uniref:Retrotransposon gag domain-containing protein n=1 Tax=Phytophthora nicotianae P10297 TaxID=1317064 RepID=W3A7P4_PHYNI|nr:hypothetical protein F442_00762 [Phytophthora nicotianae P10297]